MYAIDAERGILGACMIDKASIDEAMDRLNENDFSSANKRVFQAIQELYKKGETVDAITVSEKLHVPGHNKLALKNQNKKTLKQTQTITA